MNKTAVLNMSGTLSCFICVILGFYSTSGQLWEKETLRNETFCDFKNLNLSCSSDEMIALHSLQYAYNVRCETTCCNTYTSTDCFVNATSSDIQGLRRKCSGQPTCTLPSPPSKLDFCSLGTKTASYMFLQYYCIQKTRVSSICSSGQTLTSDAEPLYLTNANYPGVTTGSDSCSCSLEVYSCTSGINLYIFDADLYWETATCEQNIAFLDGTNQTLHTIGCENYYSYKIESRQINSHYMKINFINNSTQNQEGYFFIGLDATESFSLSCTFEQESWCTGCVNVPVLSNGQIDLVDVNNSSYGALANVTCDSGYETNTPTISCLANNSWADAACTEKAVICPEGLESCPHGNGSDVCVPKTAGCSCGAVPTISNGVINSVNNTIGSSAVVYCDDGYEASKPNVICQTTGLWETATCNAKDINTPEGKPTEETNEDGHLILIIVLIIVAVIIIQLVVMCFYQRKLHNIRSKANEKDNEVHIRIAMTIFGGIPIVGIIPICFTCYKYREKKYQVTHSKEGKTTTNKAFVSDESLDKNEAFTYAVHHDDIKIDHNMKAETTQMTEINGTVDNIDQREELPSRNSDTSTDKDRNNQK